MEQCIFCNYSNNKNEKVLYENDLCVRPNNRYARSGRASGIVLRDDKIMFMQQIVSGKLRHVFVGGGIEENETPEQAVLRELKEEANVDGRIIYGSVYRPSKELNHEYFFLLSIDDDQMPKLGYDPEIPKGEEQVLKGVVWRDIDKEHEKFTAVDKDIISILTTHAKEKNIQADWLNSLSKVLSCSFKENIKKYYDTEAELRNSKSVKVDWKIQVRGKFCELIKRENKKTLLELGAGAGYDSQFFMENGLKVVAVDLSSEMVKNCKEKGIETYEMDFYDLSALDKQFDSIYAINTLLHVPKNDLCHVLNEINLVLEIDGLFYMGLYGGQDTENEFVKSEVSDVPRFFAMHSESYLKATLKNYFEILDFETIEIGADRNDIFHSITMRKR